MKYDQIKDLPEENFRRLTGVKRSTFNKMVEILKFADQQKKARGGRKRFQITADKYRNRRKRFGFRFNLIVGIYNLELQS